MQIKELITMARGRPLLPDPLPSDPMPLLRDWLDQAVRDAHRPNPNSFVLATTDADGMPAARVVLCKRLEVDNAAILFFTNYESRKGRELSANPVASAVFHWDHREYQARVRGLVERTTAAESDAYFATRPLLSRLGAWASRQSEPMAHRQDLVRAARAIARRFGVRVRDLLKEDADVELPRPPYWGGYRLWADRVELWCGGKGRLHDRAVWSRPVVRTNADPDDLLSPGSVRAAPWTDGSRERLQP